MRLTTLVCLYSLCAVGCFHAQRVEKATGETAASAKKEKPAAEKPKDARPPPLAGHPPLATSPQGLMLPGGMEKIRETLVAKGYSDQPMSAALRKYQEDEELAKTGAPDRETVHRLGLNPKDIFRDTEDAQKDQARLKASSP